MPNSKDKKPTSGRPPKFDEPSRPVTLTLPVSILDGLKSIDDDKAQAIVRLTENALSAINSDNKSVEIVRLASGNGIIVVAPCQTLRNVPFLELVEIVPGRCLLVLEAGKNFNSLELALHDLMDEHLPETDSKIIQELLEVIKSSRKSEQIRTAEILVIEL